MPSSGASEICSLVRATQTSCCSSLIASITPAGSTIFLPKIQVPVPTTRQCESIAVAARSTLPTRPSAA